MKEINQLLVKICQQWQKKSQININDTLDLYEKIKILNRKENKPLRLSISFYKQKQIKNISGIADYLALAIKNNFFTYLNCELLVWRTRKKISQGKKISYRTREIKKLKIPIFNIIAVDGQTIPTNLKKYI